MFPEITPEQKEQLSTWADQRDALLFEISGLRTEKEKLEAKNIDLASSYTKINDEMNQVTGRIAELEKKEKELADLKSKEVTSLESEKSRLNSEIINFKNIISILVEQKNSIEHDVVVLTEVFNKVNDRVSDLDKIVDHVTRVSSDNKHEINELTTNLKKTLDELIDVNTKNVFETNVVIDKLPKMLVEAQKKGLIRHKI